MDENRIKMEWKKVQQIKWKQNLMKWKGKGMEIKWKWNRSSLEVEWKWCGYEKEIK